MHDAEQPRPGRPRRRMLLSPQGLFTFLVLRPVSDLFLWLWRLERRMEFLYRPQFDRWCTAAAVRLPRSRCRTRGARTSISRLAEERMLPGEEEQSPARSSMSSRSSPGRTGCPAAHSGSATPRPSACSAPSSRCCPRFPAASGTACSPSRGPIPRGSAFPGRARTRRRTSRITASARSRSR